jgi:serine/threonine protein phosphatase 1
VATPPHDQPRRRNACLQSLTTTIRKPFRTGRTLPAGRRVYAVGDLHGQLDLLGALLAEIDRLEGVLPPAETEEVFIGDYVDRGPASAGVLACLAGPSPRRRICLKGNHEVMMQSFLSLPDNFQDWRQVGGLNTLASYGVARPGPNEQDGVNRVWRTFQQAVPEAHRIFIEHLWHFYRLGDYLFVHAGIRPGVAMDAQEPRDLFWIRGEFLESPIEHGFLVVHGHSPALDVDIHPNRIGIDTGAYATRRLSCLMLQDDNAWVIQVHPRP